MLGLESSGRYLRVALHRVPHEIRDPQSSNTMLVLSLLSALNFSEGETNVPMSS